MGNTPTRELFLYAHYEIRDDMLSADYPFSPYENVTPTPAMIAPKQTVESGAHDLFGDELLAIKEGRKYFFVWGIARYRDVFPNTTDHITKFCVYAAAVTGEPLQGWNANTNPLDIAFAGYHRHNCADEDCFPD
jgi:hypothetical protein